jgi:hypothetical protein
MTDKNPENRKAGIVLRSTDEQTVLYCIEIPYQKLGLYWYWLIYQISAIPNQYQQKNQIKKTFQATQCFIQNIHSTKHNKQ